LADEYPYDPDAARALLADAGYPDGFDLTIPVFGTEQYEPVVAQYLADIGIRVTYDRAADGSAWIAALQTGQFPATLIVMAPGDLFPVFADPIGPGNVWHQENNDPELVELIGQFSTGTPDEIKAARARIGEKFVEEAWFGVIAHTYLVTATRGDMEVGKSVYGIPPMLYQIHPAS
jgi:peptide/nickel transport system substrate-binding protein